MKISYIALTLRKIVQLWKDYMTTVLVIVQAQLVRLS